MLIRATVLAICVAALSAPVRSQPLESTYPTMAPLGEYLMPEGAEIALARSAAPISISGAAEVMVLRRDGYVSVARGSNGFVCVVERGWASDTHAPDFWNPRLRAPNCFNEAAAATVAQIYFLKTRMVLAGRSKSELLQTVNAALDSKAIPPLAPGAMVYMMSKQQYLGDADKVWHPHLMFYVAGNASRSWGGNLAGSPVMAANDPEERLTIFMIKIGHWSDGSPDAV